jgi:hypothetical protein
VGVCAGGGGPQEGGPGSSSACAGVAGGVGGEPAERKERQTGTRRLVRGGHQRSVELGVKAAVACVLTFATNNHLGEAIRFVMRLNVVVSCCDTSTEQVGLKSSTSYCRSPVTSEKRAASLNVDQGQANAWLRPSTSNCSLTRKHRCTEAMLQL